MNARVEVEYLGKAGTAFRLQFDGLDDGVGRAYQPVLPGGGSRHAVRHRRGLRRGSHAWRVERGDV